MSCSVPIRTGKQVYIKWNERGFEEATKAYQEGRIRTDPAKSWYRDELIKFDNFVIPLTMQMKDIDAFVVSSDEYLVSDVCSVVDT